MTQFLQTQQSTNTEFRIALNDVRSQITKLTSSMGNIQQEKGKPLFKPFKTSKVKIVLESQVQVMAPSNIARLSPLFEVEK